MVAVLLTFCLPGCNRQQATVRGRKVNGELAGVGTSPRRGTRKAYPYSLIPGGVESGAEFLAHRAADPLLSNHYEGIGTSIVLKRLARDQWMHASYRVGNEIFWTKKPLLIRAGESVLSDGAALVRARCGNRLSLIPRQPVRQFEPPVLTTEKYEIVIVEILPPELTVIVPMPPNLPVFPAPAKPAVPPARIAVVPPNAPPDQLNIPIPGAPPPLLLPPNRGAQTVNTPEVSTWLLMLLGLFLVWVAIIRGNRLDKPVK